MTDTKPTDPITGRSFFNLIDLKESLKEVLVYKTDIAFRRDEGHGFRKKSIDFTVYATILFIPHYQNSSEKKSVGAFTVFLILFRFEIILYQ